MRKRNHFLFLLLFIYVLLQSSWWLYNIYDLSVNGGGVNATGSFGGNSNTLYMVMGEGAVFIVILSIGFFITHRSMKKEIAVSAQQRNFLLAITHELKTPIASLKLYLQTLQRRALDESKKAEIIQKSIQDADRLNGLVENILLATKIDDGVFPLYKEQIQLSELIEDITLRLIENSGRHVGVEYFVQPNVAIEADKAALISVITNLTTNAIKYTPDGSSICVSLVQKDGETALSIADEGPGVSEEEEEKIFEKFYRSGNEETRKTKGTGLGLFIVRHLVEAHDGQILVRPNKPKGSIFVASFR